MPYLGDDSNIPLINRGAGAYNNPATAAPYVAPQPAEIPLINQGASAYNFPELFATVRNSNVIASPTYTPVATRRKNATAVALVIAAATGFLLLGGLGEGRRTW